MPNPIEILYINNNNSAISSLKFSSRKILVN